MNKSKGRNAEHSQKMGQFDRSAFKASGEKVFDEKFGFERGLTETFKYANTQKKGSLEERINLQAEKRSWESAKRSRSTEQQQHRKNATEKPLVSLLEKGRPSNHFLERELKNLPDLLSDASDNLLQSLLGTPNKDDGAPLLPRKKDKKRKGIGL